MSADLVVKNARVYTVDPSRPWAEALAVDAGRLTVVGSADDVTPVIGPDTEVIDLDGAFVMPGIYDMHCHPDLALVPELLGQIILPEMATPEQIRAAVLSYADEHPDSEWIVAHGWEPTPFTDAGIEPGMAWIDSFMPDRPVFLVDRSRVFNMFNRRAADLAGITETTPNPRHGSYRRDATGSLLGLVIDGAQAPFWDAIGEVPQAVYEAAYRTAVGMYSANGVVGAKFSHMSIPMIEAVHRLDEDGELTLRCETHLSWKDDIGAVHGRWDYIAGQRLMYRSELVNPNGVKFHFDGVTPARTGYMLQPYRGEETWRGSINLRPAEIDDVVVYLDRLGIRVDAHCIGDGAVRLFLDAVERARTVNGPGGPRHQSTHSTWVDRADITRFAELDVIPEFSPVFWFPSASSVGLRSLLTDEQADAAFPIADVVAAGGRAVIGTDWPVTTIRHSWVGLEALVTRANPSGDPSGTWGAPISLEEAIRMLTINGAWSMELEDETGSLEVGKSADFIVLDRNLFEIDAGQIHDVQVKSTVFRGQAVHVDDDVRAWLAGQTQSAGAGLAFP